MVEIYHGRKDEPACGHVDTWMFDRLEVLEIETDDPENITSKVLEIMFEELDMECWGPPLPEDRARAIGEKLKKAMGVHGIIVKCEVCGQDFCISTGPSS